MNKKLLSITILCLLGLTACGAQGESPADTSSQQPETSETSTINWDDYQNCTVSITNKEALQKTWHVGESGRNIELELNPNVNINQYIHDGIIRFESSNEQVLKVAGRVVKAIGVGTATVTVKYGKDGSDTVEITVSEPVQRPDPTEGTVADILADENGDGARLYHITGYIHDWKSKSGVNEYGEFNLSDTMDKDAPTLYVYGSYVNTATFDWTGEKFTIAYTTRDFHTADITKNAKIGDRVEVYMIRTDYGTTLEAKGQILALTPGDDVPATAINLSKNNVEIEVEGSDKVTVTSVEPWNCNLPGVWASENEEIATVNGGNITGVAVGTTKVTYTIGELKAEVNVTVKEKEGAKLSLNAQNLLGYTGSNNVAYYGEPKTATVGGVEFSYLECGAYGTGIQMRYKKVTQDKDVKDGHVLNGEYYSSIANTTAFEAPIDHIVVELESSKSISTAQDNAFKFKFGTSAEVNVEDADMSVAVGDKTWTITPTAKTNTFFSMTKTQTSYSYYFGAITIYFVEA